MINNPIIFYSASFMIIVFALLVIFSKSVINSLLSSIVVFLLGALFFYVLGSEYNAIIQAAIYGFAVPILIGVSIMFVGAPKDKPKPTISYWMILFACIFALAFVYLMMISLAVMPDTFNVSVPLQINSYDTLRAFASGIFVNYVWAFELVSLLLTIVIAGIGIIRKRGF